MIFCRHKYTSIWWLLIGAIQLISTTICYGQETTSFHDQSDGLSQNTITAITQDDNGFLWVGTRYGLNKYDGNSYEHFLHQNTNPNSISANTIEQIVKGRNGILWIGTTRGGLNKLHVPSSTFEHFTDDNSSLKSNYIRILYLDENGYLYIAGENTGLVIMDTSTETFLDNYNHILLDRLKDKDITSLHGNGKGSIVIGTAKHGIYYYNSITQTITIHPDVTSNIRSVIHHGDHEFLIGTNSGLYVGLVDKNTFTLSRYDEPTINNSVILSLLKEEDGTIWIGTENDGLFEINAQGKINEYTSNNSESSPNGNSIWTLYKDRHDIIWIGYYLNGLSKIDQLEEKFTKVHSANIEDRQTKLKLVNTFTMDGQKCWIGLDGGGLIEWDRKKNVFNEISSIWNQNSDKVITCLHFKNNKLWIGTWNEGIIVYNLNDQKSKRYHTLNNEIIGNRIRDIIEDSKGNIWVTSHEKGLNIFSDEDNAPAKLLESPGGINQSKIIRIRDVAEDCDGNIILGGERSGLIKLTVEDGEIIKTINVPNQSGEFYKDITVNTLLIDSKCNIWVGSQGHGLYRIQYGNSETQNFNINDGLSSNMIYSLLQDDEGNIWGSTNNGIFKYNPEKETYNTYTEEDGLVSNEFVLGSSYKAENGDLLFGGINGINYFNPNNITYNDKRPKAYITNIHISDQEYASVMNTIKLEHYNSQRIKTKHDQNDIAFVYTAPNFTQGNLNKFQYILEGYEDDWRPITTDRIANYSNIPSGKYTFKLKASNNDNIWSENLATVSIIIKKPWYRTILAYIIYIAIFSSLFYFIQTNIINQVNLKNELELETLNVSQLKEIDKIKSKFFANISHEFLTPLTLILTPLKAIESKGDNIIKDETIESMMNNANRLQKFIKQILALTKIESGNVKLRIENHVLNSWLNTIANNFNSIAIDKSMEYEIEIPNQTISAYFDEDKLEQVIVNLLSNAFKYTGDYGRIKIILRELEDSIQISITDNGNGIEPEALQNIFNRFYRQKNENLIGGTGIGLSISKQILEQHDAEIVVKSRVGVGSEFMVLLKKGNEHFNNNPFVEFIAYDGLSPEENQKENQVPLPIVTNNSEFSSKPIILIAEDNPDIRNLLADYLGDKYQIYLAEDGIQGINLASKIIPDIIITDLMMPGKTGYELCDEVKSNRLTSHISIIMLTVKSSEESIKKGLLKGADYYITKPFSPELLAIRIQNILRSRKGIAKSIIEDATMAQIEEQDDESEQLSPLDKEFVERLNSIIERNMSNSDFSVVDLTHQLGFSKSQLYRKLKAIIGVSANSYIRTKRLQKATELISTNNYTIAEVTYKVGFNDLQYFRSCFKNAYGVNPSDYNGEIMTEKVT